jgi:hypothetical protein
MGALLESGMVGNIGLKHLRVIKEDTIKKWDELGFLEGLDGHQKDNIAQLYENQASYLINEAAVADASGSFETVVFPIIRRVFSKLLANDIVSVQAMNLPIGKLFFFIPKIQERSGGTDHYSPYGGVNNDLGLPTDPTSGYNDPNVKNLYDRFYESSDANDQGLFDYSKGKFSVEDLTVNGFTTFANGVVTTSTSALTSATCVNKSYVIIEVTGFTSAGAGKLKGANGNEMDSEEFLASLQVTTTDADLLAHLGATTGTSLPINIVTQKYGKGIVEYGAKAGSAQAQYYDVCDADGKIYIQVDLEAYDKSSGFSPYSVTGTSTLARTELKPTFRLYESLEFEEQIGEVSFDLQSVTVSVTERKLRASWSP